MTREAGLCCGLSTTMASRLAPGRHDASCTLVVKVNSATRLSLSAGQPKPMRASLLTQVCGTAVRRPLGRDTRSSRTALRAGRRIVAEAHLDHQKAPIGAEGCVGHRTRRGQFDRYPPAGGHIQHLHATACDARRRPGDLGCTRRDHSVEGATGLRGGWIPQLVGHRPRRRGHWCQQQAAAGPLLDPVPGRKPELRPEFPASDADFPRGTCGRARIGSWGVAGQPQRARHAWGDRVRLPCQGRRPPAIGQEKDSMSRSSATAANGLCIRARPAPPSRPPRG